MFYSHIPSSPSSPNDCECAPTPISCTRCRKLFYSDNEFSMTCPACCKRDVDYTVRLGNQARIFQIDVSLMNIAIELSIRKISNDRKLVLEKLVAQLKKEKQDLSQNI